MKLVFTVNARFHRRQRAPRDSFDPLPIPDSTSSFITARTLHCAGFLLSAALRAVIPRRQLEREFPARERKKESPGERIDGYRPSESAPESLR